MLACIPAGSRTDQRDLFSALWSGTSHGWLQAGHGGSTYIPEVGKCCKWGLFVSSSLHVGECLSVSPCCRTPGEDAGCRMPGTGLPCGHTCSAYSRSLLSVPTFSFDISHVWEKLSFHSLQATTPLQSGTVPSFLKGHSSREHCCLLSPWPPQRGGCPRRRIWESEASGFKSWLCPLARCVITLGELFNRSEPQLSHL